MKRTILKIWTAIVVCIILLTAPTGCAKDAERKVKVSNPNFDVQLLFEKDGCKIYRFMDGGHYVYWTNCDGNVSYSYQQVTGKSSVTVRVQNETTGRGK